MLRPDSRRARKEEICLHNFINPPPPKKKKKKKKKKHTPPMAFYVRVLPFFLLNKSHHSLLGEVPGSIPAVAARSLLVGSVSV